MYLDKTTFDPIVGLRIVLWCLTPLSKIFQLHSCGQLNWWRKPEFPDKTTNWPHGTGKLYHIQLYQVHIGISAVGDNTDCIGCCKSN